MEPKNTTFATSRNETDTPIGQITGMHIVCVMFVPCPEFVLGKPILFDAFFFVGWVESQLSQPFAVDAHLIDTKALAMTGFIIDDNPFGVKRKIESAKTTAG